MKQNTTNIPNTEDKQKKSCHG